MAAPARSHYLLAGLLFFLLAVPAFAQDGSEPIRASDLFKIRQLGDVAVSPDGRQVAYTVRTIEETDSDEDEAERPYTYRTHIYLVDAGGGEPRPLTRGDRSARNPAWHPDGDRLAFVREVEGTAQVFVLPLTGGEPYQLTRAEHGATSPKWSPDGSKLLYASSLPPEAVREATDALPEWPSERPGRTPADTAGAEPDPDGSLAEVRAWLAENQEESNPRVLTRLDFQDEHDLEPQPSFRHLFVIDVEGNSEPGMVTQGYYSYGGGEWLPNGEQVVFSGAPDPDRHPDRVREGHLYVASADGEEFTRLLQMEGYTLSSPTPAPNGETLAFLAQALDDPGYAQSELGLYELSSDASPRLLTADFDRDVGAPRWSPDGWFLYTVAPSDGGFPLYRLAPFEREEQRPSEGPTVIDTLAIDPLAVDALTADTLVADTLATPEADTTAALAAGEDTALEADTADAPAIERLTSYERGVRSFDVSTATVFYVMTEVANPFELYSNNTEFASERRLTSHNASWLEDKRLAEAESFTVERDTLEIQAWTMRPTFYEEGETYPLLLQMHGGPSAMWGPGEATMWHEFQYFAAQGYGIVYANPRGSGGYGHAFKKANYRDWGTGPAGDVLAAASEAAEEPRIDSDRQVMTGGSYAGYLTAWIVAHDDRFEAAVAQRGVYDLGTFLGEGNAWRLVPWHFGGYPWDRDRPEAEQDTVAPDTLAADTLDALADSDWAETDTLTSAREVLIQNSPLTYVDQVQTPLLIIHSDNDLRTGVSQSEMLYRSLKILERPVEYVRYPDAAHDLSRTGDPKQRLDRILRIREFFERYLDREETTAARQ